MRILQCVSGCHLLSLTWAGIHCWLPRCQKKTGSPLERSAKGMLGDVGRLPDGGDVSMPAMAAGSMRKLPHRAGRLPASLSPSNRIASPHVSVSGARKIQTRARAVTRQAFRHLTDSQDKGSARAYKVGSTACFEATRSQGPLPAIFSARCQRVTGIRL